MLAQREIEALDQAGLSPELRDEVVAQAEGAGWVGLYRAFLSPWWMLCMVGLALTVGLFTRDVIHPFWLVIAFVSVPAMVLGLALQALFGSQQPEVRFRNRLIRLSLNASRRWGGDKAQLDLAELADYVEGAENAAAALAVMGPYRRKQRLYQSTFVMGLGLVVITIAFLTIGLPLMLGLG